MKLSKKPESDAAYLQELNEAVASIDTHLTIPAEEVFAWMRTWGTEDETALEKSGLFHSSNMVNLD